MTSQNKKQEGPIIFSSEYDDKHLSLFLGVVPLVAYKFALQSKLDINSFYRTLRNLIETDYGSQYFKQANKSLNYYIQKNVEPKIQKSWIDQLPHKYRLKILIYLFKIASSEKKINIETLGILGKYQIELNISNSIYSKIKIAFNVDENYNYSSSNYNKHNNTQTYNPLSFSYKILGVNENASSDQIKKAYRTLAKKFHPDKNLDKNPQEIAITQAKFREIVQAYNVLKEKKI